jgi:hypothetical protein
MQPCHAGEPWSELYGSNAASPVVAGDFVHIFSGQTVLLDEATVELGGLWVEGTLVFDHSKPGGTVELRTAYAVVTGAMQIGCKSGSTITRFTKKTHLTLIAPELYYNHLGSGMTAGVNWPSEMATEFDNTMPVYEAALDRGLVIAGTGRLYIYGNDSRDQGWTTLRSNVDAGDWFLPLTDPIAGQWKANDEIVIASTDFEYADQWQGGLGDGGVCSTADRGGHEAGYVQGEERLIASVDAVNQGINLDPTTPLAYKHWGEAFSATFGSVTETIEERAEIANLTRSVVIRGESSAYSRSVRGDTTHLGHVILLKHENAIPYCEVDWTEFRNLGVEGKLGRYPFHWHMLGDARNGTDRPYLRDSSIHHCVNRFVTVHNSTHVDIERNVGYDTLGAGFFLEDATEDGDPVGNLTQFVILRGNLGMKVGRTEEFVDEYPPAYMDLEQIDPSVFWIQHPNQIVEGNHAAGAAGHGFYLSPSQDFANGYSHPANGDSSFKNNIAHSNGQNGFYNNKRVEWNWTGSSNEAPTAEGLVAWKNRRYGIWWRTHGVALLQGCKAADNRSGFYPASGGRQDAHDGNNPATCRLIINNAVVFGETANIGVIINNAETDAGRSLPETYWHFLRPEPFPNAFEKEWGTLNAIESYDGRNVITGLKVAFFPGNRTLRNPNSDETSSAVQLIAAITQTEYNSRYIEDPRNSVEGLVVGAGTIVQNRIAYRTTDANEGFSMIRNTVVYDPDDSLGHGADVFVCYNDPFFDANATATGTVVSAQNLRIVPSSTADFAQFEVRTNLTTLGTKLTVSVNHHAGGQASMLLTDIPDNEPPAATADYGFNAPIGLDTDSSTAREGIYRCAFGNMGNVVPGDYEIKIQFAEAEDVPTIIGVPLAATPTSLTVNGLDLILLFQKSSLENLLATGDDHAFYFDTAASPPMLYVRTTTVVLGPNVGTPDGPDLDGTRNVIKVNR